MVRAFIMVKTVAGKAEGILGDVRTAIGVEEAHVVAGQYDLIVEAERNSVYEVMESVASGIRDIEGVADTRTYMCLE
ncbi:Lrp/AsnC family transcriptional regulator [Halorhabdus sp. CBA1104]|uniref:Lrp/AsnC ligand binding domain-containing protein n=1 Tax=unclassified Halorhabdus TaxID=2621901 RepID=UPI0012B1987F|nr:MULTISPECIES: Lrp/AsnC ligand binding domain-containing protein [unclassified Halorhabdus]QGN08125.1 Lrp/AsnC family transcriptional regulator [Halorhabdus sp. CBA1104]